ncbi:hypothetical protein Pmani_006104 [Petrolisthes manimaculis]|uniref:Uncharacterized protein n=1 Tax=Petrolisthes manimaculis TaxID=1843537 RepID=A0AAE1QBK0_9EUCA|nr:hypothetical protein Pmani_006104 [Petrolisthes manimaculis]
MDARGRHRRWEDKADIIRNEENWKENTGGGRPRKSVWEWMDGLGGKRGTGSQEKHRSYEVDEVVLSEIIDTDPE